MRFLSKALCGLGLALAIGSNAQAQTIAAQAISPQKLALAQQVVDAAQLSKSVAFLMNTLLRPFAQQIEAGGASADLKTYTVGLLQSEVSVMEGRMLPLYAQIYARTFDESQLADILAFYQSPTGRLLLEKQPELARESQIAVAPLIPEMQRDMVDKLFAHICEMQACTPEQRTQLSAMRDKLLTKFAAQTAAPSPRPASSTP